MKYKVGDKVRIRTWKDIQKLDPNKSIEWRADFIEYINRDFKKNYPDRIVEIVEISSNYYLIKGSSKYWAEYMIEGLVNEIEIINLEEKIKSRFEILDIRKD